MLAYSKVFNKINNTDEYWVNEETKNFFSDCKICVGKDEQDMMINKLFDMGMIKLGHKVDSNGIKVEYADDTSEVIIVIDDFKNFIYYWLEYKGENVKRCEACKKIFKPQAKYHKYCKQCAKEKQKESKRITWDKNKYKYTR